MSTPLAPTTAPVGPPWSWMPPSTAAWPMTAKVCVGGRGCWDVGGPALPSHSGLGFGPGGAGGGAAGTPVHPWGGSVVGGGGVFPVRPEASGLQLCPAQFAACWWEPGRIDPRPAAPPAGRAPPPCLPASLSPRIEYVPSWSAWPLCPCVPRGRLPFIQGGGQGQRVFSLLLAPPAPDANLAMCWQEVGPDLVCSRPRLDRRVTYTECCCLYGEAWSMDCALCPARDSGGFSPPGGGGRILATHLEVGPRSGGIQRVGRAHLCPWGPLLGICHRCFEALSPHPTQ